MRKFSTFLAAGVLAVLIAGCGDKSGVASSGGSSNPDEAVTLRLNPKAGEKYNYSSTMKMQVEAQGQTMNMDMAFDSTREVASVEGGKITIKESAKNAKVTADGMMAAIGPQLEKTLNEQVTTKVYDECNRIVEGGDTATAAGGNDFSAVYPEKPIKKGDTWTDTISSGGTEMTVNFTAAGIENVGGTRAMKIVMDFPPDNPMKFKGPLNFWVDVASGMQIKAEGQVTGEQEGQKLKLDISMSKA